jgi:hypothetical protein
VSFIDVLVNELDLAPFLAAHDEPRGMPPYHPALMLKVLLYGYAIGVTSSRKLEERLASDVGFMFLVARHAPATRRSASSGVGIWPLSQRSSSRASACAARPAWSSSAGSLSMAPR